MKLPWVSRAELEAEQIERQAAENLRLQAGAQLAASEALRQRLAEQLAEAEADRRRLLDRIVQLSGQPALYEKAVAIVGGDAHATADREVGATAETEAPRMTVEQLRRDFQHAVSKRAVDVARCRARV